MWRLVKFSIAAFIIFIGILISIKATAFFNPNFETGFLADKEPIFDSWYKYFLYVHIICSPIILFIGTIQILILPTSFKKIHKILGYSYVFLIPFAAVSGFVMGFIAIGGIWSTTSFTVMSILWIAFTSLAIYFAKNQKTLKHKRNMIRSYILAVSAVNLRLLSFIFIYFFNWDGDTMYTSSVWISWLVPLVIYEIYYLKNK